MIDNNYKTKKEVILENATRDPFLKVNDLAELADTTSRYVRTILSDADLSLMKLRKDYARQLVSDEMDIEQRFLLSRIFNVHFQTNHSLLEEEGLIFNKPEDIEILNDNIYNDYYYFYFSHFIKNIPWCLSIIYLNKNDIIEDKTFQKDKSLLELIDFFLDMLKKGNYELSNIELRIEPCTAQVAGYLKVKRLSPVLQARQTLSFQNRVSALVLTYMDTRQVCFSLSGNKGMVIKHRNNAG